jgi:glucose-6-phosphate isomerase
VKQFNAPAGIEVGFNRDSPAIGPGIRVDQYATRTLGAMSPVTAEPAPAGSRRIQYWMVNGTVREADAAKVDPSICYDFTYLPDRPVGWERTKTFGHSHPRPGPGRIGLAEIIEVLHGTIGFIVADLLPGPRSTFAALVVGKPGDTIILPPQLSHASCQLGGGTAVFSDVIDRRMITGVLPANYEQVRAARGMAYYIDLDGNGRPNPNYLDVAPLQRFTAEEWSGPASDRPLYRDYVEHPELFAWITDPELFPAKYPTLWQRVESVVAGLNAVEATRA